MEYSGETTTEKRLAKCTPIEKNQKREEYLKKTTSTTNISEVQNEHFFSE